MPATPLAAASCSACARSLCVLHCAVLCWRVAACMHGSAVPRICSGHSVTSVCRSPIAGGGRQPLSGCGTVRNASSALKVLAGPPRVGADLSRISSWPGMHSAYHPQRLEKPAGLHHHATLRTTLAQSSAPLSYHALARSSAALSYHFPSSSGQL